MGILRVRPQVVGIDGNLYGAMSSGGAGRAGTFLQNDAGGQTHHFSIRSAPPIPALTASVRTESSWAATGILRHHSGRREWPRAPARFFPSAKPASSSCSTRFVRLRRIGWMAITRTTRRFLAPTATCNGVTYFGGSQEGGVLVLN